MEQPTLIGKAEQFNEKINTIKKQFFSALDDYTKYYVYYNKNPEVNEFQNYYANSKSQLQNMSRELFLITNNIDKTIEMLDTQMSSASLKLTDEKNLNKELNTLTSNLQNTQDGSVILIEDSKTNYNIQYYKNLEIFVGILIIGCLLASLFKKKIPVPTPINK